MRHQDAPVRIYRKPNGKEVLWTDDENPPWLEAVPVGQIMDAPPPSWRLVRGFRTPESYLEWLVNHPILKPNVAMQRWLDSR